MGGRSAFSVGFRGVFAIGAGVLLPVQGVD